MVLVYSMRAIHNLGDLKNRRKNLRNNATPQEIILWNRLKNRGLGVKFRRQHSIGTYIVDFCCPEAKIIVELDGSQHAGESAECYDQARTHYLQQLGFRVLRFWNNEININLESVLMSISDVVHHVQHHPLRQESETPPQLRRGREKSQKHYG